MFLILNILQIKPINLILQAIVFILYYINILLSYLKLQQFNNTLSIYQKNINKHKEICIAESCVNVTIYNVHIL